MIVQTTLYEGKALEDLLARVKAEKHPEEKGYLFEKTAEVLAEGFEPKKVTYTRVTGPEPKQTVVYE